MFLVIESIASGAARESASELGRMSNHSLNIKGHWSNTPKIQPEVRLESNRLRTVNVTQFQALLLLNEGARSFHTVVELLVDVGQVGKLVLEELELALTGGQEAVQIEQHFAVRGEATKRICG